MAADPDRPGAGRWVPPDADVMQLRAAAQDCRGCELWHDATQVVFGEGPERVRLMLVGEQPGDREDLVGEPFVGPAGKLLDRVGAERGVPLTLGERVAVVTTHPSALLRMQDESERQAAFDSMVADLTVAASR